MLPKKLFIITFIITVKAQNHCAQVLKTIDFVNAPFVILANSETRLIYFVSRSSQGDNLMHPYSSWGDKT